MHPLKIFAVVFCLPFLPRPCILSIKASSFLILFLCPFKARKELLGSSAPAPPLVFFLGFFFADFVDSTARLFGLGVLVLGPFLFPLLFLKNSDFGKAISASSISETSAPDVQAYPSPFGREQLPTSPHLRSPFPANLDQFPGNCRRVVSCFPARAWD